MKTQFFLHAGLRPAHQTNQQRGFGPTFELLSKTCICNQSQSVHSRRMGSKERRPPPTLSMHMYAYLKEGKEGESRPRAPQPPGGGVVNTTLDTPGCGTQVTLPYPEMVSRSQVTDLGYRRVYLAPEVLLSSTLMAHELL